MRVSLFIGDIAEAIADAVCTSTNPRLSLMMGTGAAIRARGGYEILRACEEIVVAAGGDLPAGSVHPTTAGKLPHRIAIHCVASTSDHRSTEEIVRRCADNALSAAAAAGCRSVAMPVFATGHAHVAFSRALTAMALALRAAPARIEEVVLVVFDGARAEEARNVVEKAFGGKISVTRPENLEEAQSSWWAGDE